MTTARPALAGLTAALVLALSACGSSGTPSPVPTPPVSSAPSAAGTPASGPHGDADVAFATAMLPHHEQAVQMSGLLLAKDGVDADVRDLATTIEAEQAPEIAQMAGWLQGWGVTVPSGTGGMGGMDQAHDGMMSQADLDALTKAEGPEAQTLFLRGMVRHHQGAVAMAKTEIASGSNADAKALATSIVSSQEAEIRRMDTLLAG